MPLVTRIVQSKLSMPPLLPRRIERASLVEALFAEPGLRVVLVQAPAGFGKTTLLQQCAVRAAAAEIATGWLTLDEADDDPTRFLAHLHAVIDLALDPRATPTAPAALALGAETGAPFGVVEDLFNRVTASGRTLAIFIDDLHVIESPTILAMLRRFVALLPPRLTLFLASRSVPPLGLSRMLVRGEARIVRSDELGFDREQTAEFLGAADGAAPEAAVVEELYLRTEGWPAMLWRKGDRFIFRPPRLLVASTIGLKINLSPFLPFLLRRGGSMSISKGSVAAFLYPDNFTGPELAAAAQRIERLGYQAIWYPEVYYYESFTLGGFLLDQTKRITIASGIANIYGRDPMTCVQSGRSLRSFHGDRFVMGLGVSHESIVSGAHGHAYGKPLTTMRNYLNDMARAREHLRGEDPPVVLGALGWKMIALAGELTDGAHPFNSPPEHTRRTREIVGPEKWICTAQHVCWTTDAGAARAAARKALEFYFITPNHYRNWLRLGYTERDLEGGGSDRLIDALVAWGTEEQIKDRIKQHFDAGATQVILNTIRLESTDAKILASGVNYQSIPDWEALTALAPRA